MKTLVPPPLTALIVVVLTAVSGCGGGGGGGTGISAPPTAASSAVTTGENTPVQGTLNASDPENDPLTYSIVSNGSKGTAVISNAAAGTFTYTPDPNATGTDTFGFKANDGSSDSNTATVTVTILVTNSAPVAQAGSLTIDEDTAASGTLVAVDPDFQPLTYSIVSNGSLGNAAITNPSTGAFVYVPDPNANGTDSITFLANDGLLDSNVATVTITINPVNDAPIALAGGLTTNEDTASAGTLAAVDAESQPLTYSIVSNGGQGNATLTDPATGAFVYVPDPNTNGTDSITFRASDGLLDSNVATVTITINQVNDPPVATGTCGTTRQAQTLAGTLNATDPETPALLTYSLNADGSGGVGPIVTAKGGTVTITDQTTGAFTYQPDTSAGDKRGSDTFDYQVSDPDGAVSSSTETVIVDQTIMPLGDSITQGTIDGTTVPSSPPPSTAVGFRKPLYDLLTTAGYPFDFVGTLNDGYAVANFDPDHEGHGGWRADEIAWGKAGGYPTDGVRAWLDANPSDIVMLHIGTNGLTVNTDIDVEAILDEIDLWEASAGGNHVTVVLALITDWNPLNPDVPAYNSNLVTMANNRIASGDDIVVVNQHDALTYPIDMGDNLHPNTNGYAKMANVWFAALTNLVDKCP